MSIDTHEFFRRVLPWPSDDEPGFINVHVAMRHRSGWTGTPTRDLDQFLQAVNRYSTWTTPPDIYMCMSRQGKTRSDKNNNELAAKHKNEALFLKSIYLDIDVKPPPKGYANVTEAIIALTSLCTSLKIPNPTALVGSGGGIHAYWCSDKNLSPQEWEDYALGLKHGAQNFGLRFDAGVTSDSARVLRIPGTFNYKQKNNPRLVKLLGISPQDYDFSVSLKELPPLSGQRVFKLSTSVLDGRPVDIFSNLPKESLGEGIGYEPMPPLDPHNMIKECPHFMDAMINGGKDFSQGLWNLTTLATTFLENGNALAHRMARGHPGYSNVETEALWVRKLAERQSSGLGWPSCKAIQGEGCRHCATCPHLVAAKSPLHLARVPTTPLPASLATFMASGQTGAQGAIISQQNTITISGKQLTPITNNDLPVNYVVRNDIIHKIVNSKIPGQPNSTKEIPLFHSKLYSPWAQQDGLNFITSMDRGSYNNVTVLLTQMTSLQLETTLLQMQVKPYSDNLPHIKGFLMSWLHKLHDAAAAHKTAPFGWLMNINTCLGFSYGGVLYKSDNTLGPAGSVDPILNDTYGPIGDIQPWYDAYNQLIVGQDRPGLEVIVASAFGAPLFHATGQYSVLMSIFSRGSGANKSTAASIASAVWGKPVTSKEVETATVKSVINKLGAIRHLPYFWDEIKNEPAQRKAFDVLYVACQGSEGDRLNSNITHRAKGTWQTIIGIFANISFGNYVIKQNPDTDAGLMRIFEWEEPKPTTKLLGRISPSDAARLVSALDRNYGQVGKIYAEALGGNYQAYYDRVKESCHMFEQAVADPEKNLCNERFWIAFAASVYTGAQIANETVGTMFNVYNIKKFLIEKILELRARSNEENVVGGCYDHTEQTLTEFLKAELANTVATATMPPKRAGVPPPVDILRPPLQGKPIHVQWVLQQNLLRISRAELTRWLNQPDVKGDPRGVVEALKKHFGAIVEKGSLAHGTSLRGGLESLVTVPVKPGTPLWTLMTGEEVMSPIPDPEPDGDGEDTKPSGLIMS